MAAQQSINLLLDCIICGRRRAEHDPRVLACKHGFCQTCLLDSNVLCTEGHIQCPVCWHKTPITKGGIHDLPLDTRAVAADRAFQITRKGQSCDPCSYKGDERVACAHCTSCEFKLCQECVAVHRKKEKLASHVILEEFCKIHFRDFTHACLTCYSGLCYGCIISEFHDDHEVCEMVDARDKASGLLQQRQMLLQEEIQGIDEMINSTIDESMKKVNKQRKQTEEKLNDYKTKLLESIMAALDKREQDFHKSVSQSLEKQNEASSQASNCLNEMRMIEDEGQGKLNILNTLVKTSVDMYSAVKGIRTSKNMKVNGPELTDDRCETTDGTGEGVFEFKVQLGSVFQAKPKLKEKLSIKRLSTDGGAFTDLYYVQALPSGCALLSDRSTNYVVKVNVKGQEICRYTFPDGQNGPVAVYNNDLYTSSSSGNSISVICEKQNQSIQLKPKGRYITGIVVEDDRLIVADQNTGLLIYSFKGHLKKTFSNDSFYSVTSAVCPGIGKVYLASNLSNNQVQVYNEDGDLVRSIGKQGKDDGEFTAIRKSVALPNGNILVSDRALHRLSEFTIDGTFRGHLLTEVDGLESPRCLGISYPYMWVACGNEAKMFQWV